ncbi:MAG: LLM class flavin-dependent oxidoreductase [Acidimicrobiales bacterium]
MDVGLALPQMTPDLDGARIRAWCRAIDDGPFSSVSAGERIAFDNLDGFTLVTAAAALTERARVAFNVVVAPWHAPALLAKELASIDVLGRPPRRGGRGRRPRAGLSGAGPGRDPSLRPPRCRRGRAASAVGRRSGRGRGGGRPHPRPGGRAPAPLQRHRAALLARAARWADGLTHFTLAADPAEAATAFALADDAWAAAGRPSTPRHVTGAFVCLGPGAEERLATFARRYLDVFGTDVAAWLAERMPLHTEEALHGFLVGLAATGCDEVVLVPGDADPDQVRRVAEVVASVG